jgi:hypothetical protein
MDETRQTEFTDNRLRNPQPTVMWLCMPLDDVYLAVWIAMVTENEPLPVAGACLLIATANR